MGQEIERKYLVNHRKWLKIDKPAGQHYRQGYLSADPNITIRVRLTPDSGFLTIKGVTVDTVRPEYEYPIPVNDAKELLDNFSISELSKIRYKIVFENKTWEVDEFLGDNSGLIVAEIELTRQDEQFGIPDWIDREVTGEEKYYNSSLAEEPFKKWER